MDYRPSGIEDRALECAFVVVPLELQMCTDHIRVRRTFLSEKQPILSSTQFCVIPPKIGPPSPDYNLCAKYLSSSSGATRTTKGNVSMNTKTYF